MLRKSPPWLATLSVAASVAVVPVECSAGGYFSPRYGMVPVLYGRAHYGDMFVPPGPFGHLHEYRAFDPGCGFLRRVVFTPSGPQVAVGPRLLLAETGTIVPNLLPPRGTRPFIVGSV